MRMEIAARRFLTLDYVVALIFFILISRKKSHVSHFSQFILKILVYPAISVFYTVRVFRTNLLTQFMFFFSF